MGGLAEFSAIDLPIKIGSMFEIEPRGARNRDYTFTKDLPGETKNDDDPQVVGRKKTIYRTSSSR